MRTWGLLLVLACGACGDDGASAELIAGGGIGGGSPDGTMFVHVIDSQTDEPLANVTVRVGDEDKMTNELGRADFSVSGKQTVSATLEGYREIAWVGADGANVTLPLSRLQPEDPPQATLSGTVAGWAQDLPTNHTKVVAVLYSQTDRLGDNENNLATPAMGNLCFGINECSWSVVVRTGRVTLMGAIIDRNNMGTLTESDDTNTFIGWAFKRDIIVEDGVNQSGIVLEQVEAGNLQDVTVDLGSPPAALTEETALIGIEIDDDETMQLPVFFQTDTDAFLVPKPSVLGADATYRLSAIAGTASGDNGAQSIVLRHNLTGTTLAAGEWLDPPTGVSVSRTSASFTPSAGAKAHSVQWRNALEDVVTEITIFDGTTEIVVPALIEVPAGAITARVQAIGADFDVKNFSLEENADDLWGIAIEPADVE